MRVPEELLKRPNLAAGYMPQERRATVREASLAVLRLSGQSVSPMTALPALVSRPTRFHALALAALGWLAIPLACSKKVPEETRGTRPPASAQAVNRPNEAPAKCEPGPDGRCQVSAMCSASCQRVSTPECVKCEAAGDCAPFANLCNAESLSEADRQLCNDILSCVQTTNCFDGSASLGTCYCGKLDTKKCLQAPMKGPGAPDGVCRDLILKGMPDAKVQSHVLGNLTTRAHAAGNALSRANCQKLGNKELCANVCGFGPNSPAFPVSGQ